MSPTPFTADAYAFLNDLAENNDRDWFTAHKPRYQAAIKAPSENFIDALSALISARYAVDGRAKIFRMHRDLRFAKDKRPYNTHLHMAVMDGDTGPGWMVGLEVSQGRAQLHIGYGCFGFDTSHLQHWRKAIDGPAGAELMAALEAQPLDLPAAELKRVPAPYAGDHPRADLLRRKSFSVWVPSPDPALIYGPGAAQAIAEHLDRLRPLRDWLQIQVYQN